MARRPTYSCTEILDMLPALDTGGLAIVHTLIEEEHGLYNSIEMRLMLQLLLVYFRQPASTEQIILATKLFAQMNTLHTLLRGGNQQPPA